MRILDLFCGAGGAAMGYKLAGFDVVGVDLVARRFPFEFHKADALTFPLEGFDAIHASPPCQRYSSMTKRWGREGAHPDLVAAIRGRLIASGKPYVMENVPGAPLLNPVTLCGSMFALRSGEYHLRRHRIFETNFPLFAPATCDHKGKALPVYGHAGGRSKRDGLRFPGTAAWREGMGIDWMSGGELALSIPPAYTRFVGKELRRYVDTP